jgi:hypothetical protein
LIEQLARFLASNATLITIVAGAVWLLAFPKGLRRFAVTRWHSCTVNGLMGLYVFLVALAATILGSSVDFAESPYSNGAGTIVLVGFAVPVSAALAWTLVCLLPRQAFALKRLDLPMRRGWFVVVAWLALALPPALVATWSWLASVEYHRLLQVSV